MNTQLAQPTQVTMAKYEYSRCEKVILYHIINLLQKEIKGEIQIDKNLFGDSYFNIPFKFIDPDYKDYSNYRKALKDLRAKDIIIDYFDETGKRACFVGGVINWGEIKNGIMKISINENVVIPLTETARGFTAYSSVVVIALKSVYSMRFYEYLCRFKDTGKWHTTPDALREMLGISETKTYQSYSQFKRRVIEVAQKELRKLYDDKQSDICFNLREKRSGAGRGGQVKNIEFTVFWREKGKETTDKSEGYYYVVNFLKVHFPKDKLYFEKVSNYMLENRENIEKVADIAEKATKKDVPPAYFRSVIKEECNLI